MLSPTDTDRLVRTNAQTPMGSYLRRFWQPVALSSELPERDGTPLRIDIMGEQLVAFRDTDGHVGLLDRRCPHRGADLFFGRNEECGLRCVYHGWKFNVHGKAVDLPNVPSSSNYHQKMTTTSYPTKEFGDVVWAYLGPPEHEPLDVPQLEFGVVPPNHRYVTKRLQDCNWTHSMEGALDTAHFSFLHMPAPESGSNSDSTIAADESRIRWLRDDPAPRFEIVDHDVGFVIGGARRAEDGESYWRITQFMVPTHSVTPSAMPGEIYYGYTWVPVNDETSWIYVYAWHPERPLSDEELAQFETGGFGQFAELGPNFVPVRNRANDYLIDRNDQKTLSFTGVRGVAEQDAMAQEGQGAIADRTREHLTPSDIAVVRFRQAMLGAAAALESGHEPTAAKLPKSYTMRGGGCVAPDTQPFEAVMRGRFGSATGQV
ncbi:MAG: Rieske 2Fe-2S domain-containing protein [Chromatiales bacterium]|jgi:phthalate 4,5-dioxygenase|nr:Rieske 2Fe-2S domain-containing protein [Chromatiales bacterium]